jgi:energy-coupling factor transporter ATP-binding protein EcfA2
MSELRIEGLRVRYLGRAEPALDEVSATVGGGQVVSVTGSTGAGKSTLCLAAVGLVPRVVRASIAGSVDIGDVDVSKAKAADLAGQVGIVFSAPALQLSASKPTVRDELAFGLENLAVPREQMDARIDAVMDRLGITHLADRDPLTLSGGEQQRVAIASIVVMGTDVVVLDEPAAQLDPSGVAEMAALIREMAAGGRVVMVAEHAPDILAVGDRCLVLDHGRVVVMDAPGAALAAESSAAAGIEVPTLVSLAQAAGLPSAQAFDEEAIAAALTKTVFDAAPAQSTGSQPAATAALQAPTSTRGTTPVAISIRGLVHRYEGGVEAIRGVDLDIGPGSTVAIIGQNGSGKTTLVKHLNGLLRPTVGQIEVGGRDTADLRVSDLAAQVGFVFQNPDDQLFNSRVDREVGFGPRNMKLSAAEVQQLVDKALAITGLGEQRATNPYDLDVSIRKLVALASVLAMEPSVLVLDEPTMGQDGPGIRRIGDIVDSWAGAGRTVIAVTHDMEFAARHFNRIVVMRRGEIALDAPPEVAFSAGNVALLLTTGLQPPPAARVAARMGLDEAPVDTAALLAMLRDPARRRSLRTS